MVNVVSETSCYYAFASDNCAGICPPAWEAMQAARDGYAAPYGDDPWTEQAKSLIRQWFEYDCDVFFTFNGTAANSLALAAMCRSHHSVVAHQFAHIETDECGGPEFFTHGTKLLLVDGQAGRVDTRQVEQMVRRRRDIHFPKPRVLSITQATEMGTVYDGEQMDAVMETARRLSLRVHVDGARFANALATLDVAAKELTWKVGVDVLCLGGTKNGMAAGDCVIFFNHDLAEEFAYRCKQAGQLASKMRFLSAPWVGMLREGAWLENGRHANRAARRLAEGLAQLGVEMCHPVEANSVFVRLPDGAGDRLRQFGWHFYDFIGSGGSRLMCNWNTRDQEIDALLADVQRVV